ALVCGRGSLAGASLLLSLEFWAPANATHSNIMTRTIRLRFMSFSELRRSVFAVANLFKFVKQSLVADLKLLRGTPAVPTRAVEHFQDQLLLGFTRSCPRSLFQRNLVAVRFAVRLRQHGPQAGHGNALIADSHDGSNRGLQLRNVAGPCI